MLSRDDIKQAIVEGHLKIYPFLASNLTGIGYNLTTTEFAFSINQGILLTIHERIDATGKKRFVVIPPNDTILFFSKEYIEVDNTLAGTFHSKVARVSEGLGHICTTLDPTWKGQLLLSVNNPSSKQITFDFDCNGNIMTVLFHKLDTPVTGPNIHDNNKGRCELLLAHFAEPLANKAYRKKHWELKDFIDKELANSLNGNDQFLQNSSTNDENSRKAEILSQLLTRLDIDQKKISEGSYLLGSSGQYSFFNNPSEEETFKNCVLFSMMKEVHKMTGAERPNIEEQLKHLSADKLPNAVSTIDSCRFIIQYELEMINHDRRIEWHNSKVREFAGEKSELVKVREKKQKQNRFLAHGVPIIASLAVLVTLVLLYIFGVLSIDTGIGKLVALIVSPIIAVVLAQGIGWWHKTVIGGVKIDD